MIHANIPAFNAYVEKKFLFDMDEQYARQYVPCTVFGISSYPGETLTFQTLLKDGSMFSYLPLHALREKPPKEDEKTNLELSDLVYKNCPGENIAVTKYDFLEGKVQCYFSRRDLWISGRYMFTVDWYKDNEQFHLLKLDNGQYAALPNHKVKFGEAERTFEPYKKLHQTWVIGGK